MGRVRLATLVLLVAACEGRVEVAGLYVADPALLGTGTTAAPDTLSPVRDSAMAATRALRGTHVGVFFPCDEPGVSWSIRDSALAARAAAAAPGTPVLARLRGVRTDTRGYGSAGRAPYGFIVHAIIELRPPQARECAVLPDTIGHVLSTAPPS
jgi:hypothetical protein